jgi:organic radical activating enzyme
VRINSKDIKISADTMEITYPVMESFYTIQGEGHFQGHAAYFIRLGGCDVGCHWCDVKESWPVDTHPLVSIQQLLQQVLDTPCKIVVITGGEPLMHDLNPLTKTLQEAGIRTHIETSGVGKVTGSFDWVCFSPKKFKDPNPTIYPLVNELKIVVYNKSDFKWAETFVKDMPAGCRLLLQPEWSKKDVINPLIVDFVKQNPNWNISIQTHKYLQIP